MKIVKLISVTLLCVFLFSCNRELPDDAPILKYKLLRKHFNDPPPSFRNMTTWVWNGSVTRNMIDHQMVEFKQKGLGAVCIRPGEGLRTAFASETWYDMVQYAVKRGFDLGMYVWLSDVSSCPDIFSAVHAPDELQDHAGQEYSLRLVRQQILTLDTLATYQYIYMEGDSLIDITGNAAEWEGKRGRFQLFEMVSDHPSPETGWMPVDFLHPGSTGKFIEAYMSGYQERIGSEFGDIVPGVISSLAPINQSWDNGSIPYPPDLNERFYKRWGYRLEPHLISLFEDRGDYRKIRHNYYQVLSDLFSERWAQPWGEYCQANNATWTGQYQMDDQQDPFYYHDIMGLQERSQVPGIAVSFNTIGPHAGLHGTIRALRELNSTANQLGSVRRMCGIFNGSAPELTFGELKRKADVAFALGANMLNLQQSAQTITGDRKYTSRYTFSYQSPWWDEFRTMADYYSRLSIALSSGEQHNNIMVLVPETTEWMARVLAEYSPETERMEREFNELLSTLEREQVEYDLGSEEIIQRHGRIENGKFVTGNRQYSYVVLPGMLRNLNKHTADLIEEYLVNGGTILSIGQPPGYIDGLRTDRCEQWTNRYVDQWIAINGNDDPRLTGYLVSDEFTLVGQQGGSMFHMRRELGDGQLLFINNFSRDETCSASMIMQGSDMVEMDPFTGTIRSYSCVVTENVISFEVELPPAGSKLLFISNSDIRGVRERYIPWRGEVRELELESIAIAAEAPNVLPLDYCTLSLGDSTTPLTHFMNARFGIPGYRKIAPDFTEQGVTVSNETGYTDSSQLRTGCTAAFPFYADVGLDRVSLQLVVEQPHLFSVSLNGEELGQDENRWWVDRQFGVFDLPPVLAQDTNVIRLALLEDQEHCDLGRVYLLGAFDVLPRDHGWFLSVPVNMETGSWKQQGHPFYHEAVSYSSTFTLDQKAPVRVSLPAWHGTIATVRVNGTEAGSIVAPPYELRIDDSVVKGSNTITVEVVGSLKNLLGPHHNVQRRGIVTPSSFISAPDAQPPGEEYDLLDYGLFGNFRVYTMVK
jgi:hypothetical protein